MPIPARPAGHSGQALAVHPLRRRSVGGIGVTDLNRRFPRIGQFM
jgi:hypothetical protein